VYTIRASDGGALTRVTSDPGGDDCPSDYSPNGKKLIFTRLDESVYGLFVDTLSSGKLRQVTPAGMQFNFCDGSWSPDGERILFSARVPNGDYRSTIWTVEADGSDLHQLRVPGCGGLVSDPASISCFAPSWSPNGRKILFTRRPAATEQNDLYIVNANGSGLFRVTNTPDLDEGRADWGTHSLTP
jgi:Tol biopolymer transport system component